MPESPSPPDTSATTSGHQPRPIVWLIGAIIGIGFVALVAAHFPDRIKLLGLFPLVWGIAVGAGLGWWAAECGLRPVRWLWLASWCLLIAGEGGIVLESWRVYRTELQGQFAKDPSAGFVPPKQQSGKSQLTPDEQALQQQLEAEAARVQTVRQRALSLSTYLQRRLKPLGRPSSPWPEIFWGSEMLLGSALGLWTMTRFSGEKSEPRNPNDETIKKLE